MNDLQVVWFLLIGILLAIYAILDGFDLGVGVWYLLSRREEDRRTLLKAIGPVWDGNEVWLLTGGGAIFAAFPHVYATVFSGLYLALMLVLLALIMRAVSLEFRNHETSPRWRKSWDLAFAVGSLLPALLLGVAFGNMLRGLPLDAEKNFTGSFFTLLNPYSLLIGLVGFAMFITHGALYTIVKTEGSLPEQARGWAQRGWGAYLVLFIVACAATVLTQPRLLDNYRALPVLWVLPIGTLLAIAAIGHFNSRRNVRKAFSASVASILGLFGMAGAGMFPNLVPSLSNPSWRLTIANSSSSALTLKTMLILALIGVPIVLVYTYWTYRVFGGKVSAEGEDY